MSRRSLLTKARRSAVSASILFNPAFPPASETDPSVLQSSSHSSSSRSLKSRTTKRRNLRPAMKDMRQNSKIRQSFESMDSVEFMTGELTLNDLNGSDSDRHSSAQVRRQSSRRSLRPQMERKVSSGRLVNASRRRSQRQLVRRARKEEGGSSRRLKTAQAPVQVVVDGELQDKFHKHCIVF